MCASKGRRQMSQALLVWVAGVTPAGQEALSSPGLEGVIRAEEQQEMPPGSPQLPRNQILVQEGVRNLVVSS